MKQLEFTRLTECPDLYNFQENRFNFRNGLIYEGIFYPMPEPERDRIIIKDEIKGFPYKPYIEGLKEGWNEPIPKGREKVLGLSLDYEPLRYFEIDKSVRSEWAFDFGFSIGRLYHAWFCICENIDDYIKTWDIEKNKYESNNKTFADKLECDNRDSLIKILTELINGQQGKRIAYVIMVLDINKWIAFDDRKSLYSLMRNQFTFMTSDQSINKYLNKYDTCKDQSYENQKPIENYFIKNGIDMVELEKIREKLQSI